MFTTEHDNRKTKQATLNSAGGNWVQEQESLDTILVWSPYKDVCCIQIEEIKYLLVCDAHKAPETFAVLCVEWAQYTRPPAHKILIW